MKDAKASGVKVHANDAILDYQMAPLEQDGAYVRATDDWRIRAERPLVVVSGMRCCAKGASASRLTRDRVGRTRGL